MKQSDLFESAGPPQSYDVLAEYYDADMGISHPGADIEFYCGYAMTCPEPILELGCGTGRITLPLVRSSHYVVGLDRSAGMLSQLKRKALRQLTGEEQSYLRIVQADMRDFALKQRFGLILCPYSAFTYLTNEGDQRLFFESVKRHLMPAGLFLLDTFVPHHDVSALPDDHIFFDYRREIEPGLFLERSKSITKDHTRQLSRITRNYRLSRSDGALVREFTTVDTIRYCHQAELALLLQLHGFEILHCYSDFQRKPYRYEAHMMVFIARLQA